MKSNIPRIYIAGPMNPHAGGGAIEYLRNCARMIDAARKLIKAGHAWKIIISRPADYESAISTG